MVSCFSTFSTYETDKYYSWFPPFSKGRHEHCIFLKIIRWWAQPHHLNITIVYFIIIHYFHFTNCMFYITIYPFTSKIIIILSSLIFNNLLKISRKKLFEFIKRFGLKFKSVNSIRCCHKLFKDSLEDWRTIQYDKYQMLASGIKI
jgi:hypothetical protein